jgi:hypothetical protein
LQGVKIYLPKKLLPTHQIKYIFFCQVNWWLNFHWDIFKWDYHSRNSNFNILYKTLILSAEIYLQKLSN